MAKDWSGQQEDIFAAVVGTEDDVLGRARAGTGKTTTLVEAAIRWRRAKPASMKVLVCAFSKDIKEELDSRFLDSGVEARTVHSIGWGFVRMYWDGVRADFGDDREKSLAAKACGPTVPDAIKKLVGKLCTKGRLAAPFARAAEDLVDIAIRFELEPDEAWSEEYSLETVCGYAAEAMRLAAAEKPADGILDGADMIYLPVRNKWLRKTYDLVIGDEVQDWSVTQLEIIAGVTKGRLVAFGDDRQAIFGFAGADSDSLDRLKRRFNMAEYPLTKTYRCGDAIVAEANRWVPDLEGAEGNGPGLVREAGYDDLLREAAEGDFVVSRVNAPLVSVAMALLRKGVRARVAGKNIGEGLLSLVRKLKARTVPEFLTKLSVWERRESDRLRARFLGLERRQAALAQRLEAVADKAAMLDHLANGAKSVGDIEDRVEALFTDKGLGAAGFVTCSSIHKAKGLEAGRVFVLAETLKQHSLEEQNLCYVAVTRAKYELVYVV